MQGDLFWMFREMCEEKARSKPMTRYNVDEIFQFAIRIEANGKAFYKKLADRYHDHPAIRCLFLDLSHQEGDHLAFFKKLAKKAAQNPPENVTDEYFAYLRAFADQSIFYDNLVETAFNEINNVDEALEFSMRRELESVNYYTELKKLVPAEEQLTLDHIIEEEKSHHTLLLNRKMAMNA